MNVKKIFNKNSFDKKKVKKNMKKIFLTKFISRITICYLQ